MNYDELEFEVVYESEEQKRCCNWRDALAYDYSDQIMATTEKVSKHSTDLYLSYTKLVYAMVRATTSSEEEPYEFTSKCLCLAIKCDEINDDFINNLKERLSKANHLIGENPTSKIELEYLVIIGKKMEYGWNSKEPENGDIMYSDDNYENYNI